MTATATRRRAQPRRANGKEYVTKIDATPDALEAAMKAEAELADEAAEIRGEATVLTPELFLRLWPLLRRPIPEGFLVDASRGEGKPYESTGIRSVQVSTDRMDSVLTPLWWHQEVDYHEGGKLCEVTVVVLVEGQPIRRTAWGGVDRANTAGNLRKGAYTNAGKRAFALLGVGHEVYIGATDMDPDVDPRAARAQAREDAKIEPTDDGKPIGAEKAAELVDVAWNLGLGGGKLRLAASHVVGDDVGDCAEPEVAKQALVRLTRVQAAKVERWLSRKADEAAVEGEAS